MSSLKNLEASTLSAVVQKLQYERSSHPGLMSQRWGVRFLRGAGSTPISPARRQREPDGPVTAPRSASQTT